MRISDWSSDVCSSDLFHDKSRGISFQRRTKIRWEIAGEGDARQPGLHCRGIGHRVDRSTPRCILRNLLCAGGIDSQPANHDSRYSKKESERRSTSRSPRSSTVAWLCLSLDRQSVV